MEAFYVALDKNRIICDLKLSPHQVGVHDLGNNLNCHFVFLRVDSPNVCFGTLSYVYINLIPGQHSLYPDELHLLTMRLLAHVLCKPTHFFFLSFKPTMPYSLQTSFNSVMKDMADKYHVRGAPTGSPSR